MTSKNSAAFFVLVLVIISAIVSIAFLSGQLTGLVTAENTLQYSFSEFADVFVSEGDGESDVFNITISFSDPPVNPTEFDSFGYCTSCDTYIISAAPYDASYMVAANNQSMCVILRTNSNTFVNLSMRQNASLPHGFLSQKVASSAFNAINGAGTIRFAENTLDAAFDNSSGITLTGAYQVLLANWSDGTGYGGVGESISCKWSVDPTILPAGTYTIRTDFLAVVT